jgi:hypothetical protein
MAHLPLKVGLIVTDALLPRPDMQQMQSRIEASAQSRTLPAGENGLSRAFFKSIHVERVEHLFS